MFQGFSCTFPTLDLESATSPGALVPFPGEWCLETKSRELSTLIAVSSVTAYRPFQRAKLKIINIYIYI